jgi:predicted acylesterase/phospholipase RssA
MKNVLFVSMTLPPLFPSYTYPGYKEYLEDGGVIDTLPTIFDIEIKQCDLLFILPLNAALKEEPYIRSILGRRMPVIVPCLINTLAVSSRE